MMKTAKTAPQTKEFSNGISSINRLHKKPYRKSVHAIGQSASLVFFTPGPENKWIPWTASKYYRFDFSFTGLPNFISRHIDPEIMQDYINDWAAGGEQYPTGIYFEDGEIAKLSWE